MLPMSRRVLLCGRSDLFTKPGGDTRQILNLQRHLGPSAQVSLELRPSWSGVDLVHVFNLSRPFEPVLQAWSARAAGVPVVCTAIFQDLEEYHRRGRWGAGRHLYHLLGGPGDRLEDLRLLVHLWRSPHHGVLALPSMAKILLEAGRAQRPGKVIALQSLLLQLSQRVVFNSATEESSARRLFPGCWSARSRVVPLGLDREELAAADPQLFQRHYGLRDFVLCVGRIEDLKNQLSLIQALGQENWPLVLIGSINQAHRSYARAVIRAAAARPHTRILFDLPRPIVLSAMAAAAVHVLPSWFETAGLTSLEAAALDCAVVSTDRGHARAYLSDDAHYCNPGDPRSIHAAIAEALGHGPSARLRQRVLTQYTSICEATALQGIYQEILT
jgi:glycosyltransferase involved in cell wall biosynthesis